MQNYSKDSLKTLMADIEPQEYTKQTLISLFRCFLETAIESDSQALVLYKLNKVEDYQGLLNRLKFSKAKIFVYSQNDNQNFNLIKTDKRIENDEFLIVIADRFSSCLHFEQLSDELFNVHSSINNDDVSKVLKHLQTLYKSNKSSDELENDIEIFRKDRRSNDKQFQIIKKLTQIMDSQQRDLVCTNLAINDLEKQNKSKNELANDELANIGQFCSTIAHEIRNPLSMINLYAKIISKNIEKIHDENQREKVLKSLMEGATTITNASLSLDKLLSELLDYSKPMKLQPNKYNFNSALQEVLNLVKPAFMEKKVNLKTNFQNTDEDINFDKYKFNQVLLNLLKNSLEASKEGSNIEVVSEKESTTISLKIIDQGCGISQKDVEQIFLPYFTTKENGTGIGLAESKKIMEAHGGDITVLSTDSSGTTFKLSLPIN